MDADADVAKQSGLEISHKAVDECRYLRGVFDLFETLIVPIARMLEREHLFHLWPGGQYGKRIIRTN